MSGHEDHPTNKQFEKLKIRQKHAAFAIFLPEVLFKI